MACINRFLFLLFFFFLPFYGYCQEEYDIEEDPALGSFFLADLDGDGITDSLWLKRGEPDLHLIYKLSSQNFEECIREGNIFNETYVYPSQESILFEQRMGRWFDRRSYSFEKETGKFRLDWYSTEYSGGVTGDGSGMESYDLITGEFNASWYAYYMDTDESAYFSDINLTMEAPPVYLGESEHEIPFRDLFDLCKEAWRPKSSDTIRFVSYSFDPETYPFLDGITPDGKKYVARIIELDDIEPDDLYKDDLILVTQSLQAFVYQNTNGDTFYGADMLITDIELLQPGELHLFRKNETKRIDYKDHSTLAETHEIYREDGIDYFLATTQNERIKEHLAKSDLLEICIYDTKEWETISRYSTPYLIDIFYIHEGEREKILHFLMEVDQYHGFHYYTINSEEKLIPMENY